MVASDQYDVNFDESPISLKVPQIKCVLPDLTMNLTLDGKSIENYNPYVNFDLDTLTVNIDAVDCEMSFA